MTRVERRPAPGGSRMLTAARVAAVLALTVLTGLVLAALVPLAVGYSAHVVTSGSMAPRVNLGDVVVTQPVTAAELRTGQVVLIHDPQVPGGLLLHRLVSFDEDGRLVTRGDANQSDDSVHADPSDVRGLAVLRVPWVGLPALWRAEGRYGVIALAVAVLFAGGLFAGHGWGRRAADAERDGSAPEETEGRLAPDPMPLPHPVPYPLPRPVPVPAASSSSATVVLSMTGTARHAAVRSFARPGVETTGGEEHRAPSTRRALPPVPPPVVRRRDDRAAGVRPAGPRVRPADGHSHCLDGGRFCGQPRR